jgi:hypothetical protein
MAVAGRGLWSVRRLLRRPSLKIPSDAGDTEVLLQPGFWVHASILE